MDSILVILVVSLTLASVLNIILTKFSISHIIGYIITGTIISNIFDFNGEINNQSLDLIGEFGIVFLMFTIGLEMSFARLHKMKDLIFLNGFMQVASCSIVIFSVSFYLFSIAAIPSLVVALAFSLSSTAIVLPYLKKSKDIITPYGEKSVAVLVFQDLAIIPILLLMNFLSNDGAPLSEVLLKTIIYGAGIILFMFTLGKKIIGWLLHFSANVKMEEVFLGSVFTIVIGASLIAHELGFTYSLGAFIAGMIIAETKFHIKVESDIASYKDLLLGAFFFSIGTKINVDYLLSNLHIVVLVLSIVMAIKAVIIYFIIKRKSNKSDAIKSSIALCQIGEFSFAIFALASSQEVISAELTNMLILITVLSMIVTPFMINNIYKIASVFVVEYFESDKITPVQASNHTIVCGFSILGRIVAKELTRNNITFFIISDNLQHVLLARKRGYTAYFGHIEKRPVLESLKVEQSKAIILTVSTINNKKMICEAILDYHAGAKLVVKVNTIEEKTALKDVKISSFVHAQHETAMLLVKKSIA
ncbi:cation:proton antiporter [Colwellia sp. D2M02]|uniref:cation:proton antiporter domain-containing protein n=1 Tax=Colwellia sp. D2M02 TaxID=2841562 RepID=UPI001C083F2F|nr:cation:proton antiporter [Colwellia sp. D2M02]MBU2893339.1 cation:proton antiporter [Colwellia sp. D2M02]